MNLNKVKKVIVITMGVCIFSFLTLQISTLAEDDGTPGYMFNYSTIESTINL